MAIVYATSTAQVSCGGAPAMVRIGTHWQDTDPIVIDNPSLFSSDARFGLSSSNRIPDEPLIESASAAPGEKRQVRRSE